MPRPRKPGAPSPKRRSRNGCWPCKSRKIKCDEARPICTNCSKASLACDYSIRLNWEGRRTKQADTHTPESQDESTGGQNGPSTPSVYADSSASSPGLSSVGTPGCFSVWQVNGIDDQPNRPRKRARVDADASTSAALSSPSMSSSAHSPPVPPLRPTSTGHHSRRLSVNSLLLGPPGPLENMGPIIPGFPAGETVLPPIQAGSDDSYTCYGIDRGFVDLDVVKNDDFNAISRTHPQDVDEIVRLLEQLGKSNDGRSAQRSKHQLHARDENGRPLEGHYYAKPVVVRIPRKLEPLPSKLLGNPMNMMHHFLNHTAEVLVPFDGPRSNPFRTILPQLAVKNDHLLSLILAYSASHRAKLFCQPEPATRIALWVQDIFPALRSALNDPNQSISNTNVATAIMLASIEIISPTAFGYAIPWQRHLALARDLITARPGGLRWSRSVGSSTAAAEHDEIQMCNFLWSWFAYLDVLGSLSGGGERDVSSAWILDYKVYAPEDDDEIDCIMGFSTGCVHILAKIAELARQQKKKQQQQREASIKGAPVQTPGQIAPDEATLAAARELERDLARSIALPPRACPHIRATPDVAHWNLGEISAVNRAYHHAGSVHLQRRVLGKPTTHPDVRGPIGEIVRCLDEISRGGTAETSMLFPLFTVGCETEDENQRRIVLDRMSCIERTGMEQNRRARELMERVWRTGQPWESLLTTEFIG
ncbi:hypothetical protein PpBr36_05218 [Pyricularia pennisetigena]|uniref:hypothetical protein n=1 Tax=Pyricularia pennisetigena TaxID=1578925 RepID=UPI001154A735|nr:hypothetical protein PpBr36_05218 [Pyricularia pennisetigena]TLS27644.1 hypothetical protein PpBr36_05218 [Pyricularia pennisetigena]